MKILLLNVALALSATCYSQTQDIYLHNGDDYWNQRRLQYERESERIQKLRDMSDAEAAKMKNDAAGCISNLKQTLSASATSLPILDGWNHVWVTDNNLLCMEASVVIKDDKIITFGDGKIKILWSSPVTNQKARINISDQFGNHWLDVYFIYQKDIESNEKRELIEQERKTQNCTNNLLQAYSAIIKFKPISDGKNIPVYYTDNKILCLNGHIEVSGGKIVQLEDGVNWRVIWSSDILNQKAKINVNFIDDGKQVGQFWFDVYFIF